MTAADETLIPAWVNGELTPVGKLRTHQDGLRHKAVSVFVLYENQLLIQRRAMGKYHTPGLWANTCCTHPHWDEPPEVCAHRRLKEELGIKGLDLRYRDQVEYRADVGGGLIEHEVVDIFLANVEHRIPVTPNPEEVMDVSWVDMDDLVGKTRQTPNIYTPWLRIYLEEHAAQIFS
jgi:isopentenyl-diphosphate delta-isomerase